MGAHKDYFIDLTPDGSGGKPLLERIRGGARVYVRYRVTVGGRQTVYVDARSPYEALALVMDRTEPKPLDEDIDVDLIDWWRVPITAKVSHFDDGRATTWDALVQAETPGEALQEAMVSYPDAIYGEPANLGQL